MSIHKLDITKDHCPMTFVKVKLELSKIKKGDTLEVLLSEGEPLENVPNNAKAEGYKILETSNVKDNIYKVVIKK